MPALVTYLCPRERVWLDSSRIGSLYAEFGPVEVRALLNRAMTDLAEIHREMQMQFAREDRAGFSRNLRRIRRIADNLGLSTMSRIADDVADCVAHGDAIALSATWARLSRSAFQAQAGVLEAR